MPVEIKEIVIKATVSESGGSSGGATGGSGAGSGSVIQECIEQVFRIIDDKKER